MLTGVRNFSDIGAHAILDFQQGCIELAQSFDCICATVPYLVNYDALVANFLQYYVC